MHLQPQCDGRLTLFVFCFCARKCLRLQDGILSDRYHRCFFLLEKEHMNPVPLVLTFLGLIVFVSFNLTQLDLDMHRPNRLFEPDPQLVIKRTRRPNGFSTLGTPPKPDARQKSTIGMPDRQFLF